MLICMLGLILDVLLFSADLLMLDFLRGVSTNTIRLPNSQKTSTVSSNSTLQGQHSVAAM
jgi:hypothetical protein